MAILSNIVTPVCTGVAVSLIVFFVTRFYSSKQSKKAAEIERKEQLRLIEEKKNAEKIDALTELSKAMAQHKIVTIGNQLIAQKVVTASEKAILEEIYEPYSGKTLKGNSFAKAVMEEVEKLPIVAEE